MASDEATIGLQYPRSTFGDTTETKVFVGGLAWETPTEELRRYFHQFGEILEAVVITDKNSGRSKGYGFVTFRDPESARRSVSNPSPIIDGRRANCNIAALGRVDPSSQRGRSQGAENEGPQRPLGSPYARVPSQMISMMYQTPYGYMTYATQYGYQQGVYNPQLAMQYYQQMMYGSTLSSTVGAPPRYYHQPSRAGFLPPTLQAQVHHQTSDKDPAAHKEAEESLYFQKEIEHHMS